MVTRGLRRPRTRRRMSSDARSRLAAQAAAAGYPPDLLALIAHATLPAYQPGEQLEDAQIEQVTDAVEVLAQAGYRAEYARRAHRRLPAPPRRGLAPAILGPRAPAREPPLPPPGRLRALAAARPTPTGSPSTHARQPAPAAAARAA